MCLVLRTMLLIHIIFGVVPHNKQPVYTTHIHMCMRDGARSPCAPYDYVQTCLCCDRRNSVITVVNNIPDSIMILLACAREQSTVNELALAHIEFAYESVAWHTGNDMRLHLLHPGYLHQSLRCLAWSDQYALGSDRFPVILCLSCRNYSRVCVQIDSP